METIEQIMDTATTVEWLILADAAEVVGNKLYMIGGGWDRLTINSQPARHRMSVALAFRVPWTGTNQRHTFRLDMSDEDGNVAANVDGTFEVGRPPGIPQGQAQLTQLVVNIEATFQKFGAYAITARVNNSQERSIRFNVTLGPGVAQSNP